MDRQMFASVWPVFSAEAREQLQKLSSAFLELERAPETRSPDLLDSARRIAHSLKGSSSSLGLDAFEKVVHALEDCLAACKPTEPLRPEALEKALKLIETLEAALALGDEGLEPEVADAATLVEGLKSAAVEPAEDQDILAHVWPIFRAEAAEHTRTIESGLLALERAPSLEVLETTRRAAHSLKGSAGSMGLHDIERLTHALENLLAQTTPDLPLPNADAALRAVSALEASLTQGSSKVEGLAEILKSLGEPSPEPASTSSESAPLTQLWPVFRGEATEMLGSLRAWLSMVEERGGLVDAAAEELATQHARAQHLVRSGVVLGWKSWSEAAARLESLLASLAGQLEIDAAKRLEIGAAVRKLEQACADLDTVESPSEPVWNEPVRASRETVEVFYAEARGALEELEQALMDLRSPLAENREERIEAARLIAHRIRGSGGSVGLTEMSDSVARLEHLFRDLAVPGEKAGRAGAEIAEVLVSLKADLIAATHSPAPASPEDAKPNVPSRGEQAGQAKRTPAAEVGSRAADRMLRVSEIALDSLARQVEALVLNPARQDLWSRELALLSTRSSETLGTIERAVFALRRGQTSPALDILQEVVGGLRALQSKLSFVGQGVARDAEETRLLTSVVRTDLRDLRMVPASLALEPLRRTVRDVAGRLGKTVELALVGAEVRLDRRVLEQLKDPLQHLVRNAIDHGLEPREKRRTAGKPETGHLSVTVEQRGQRVALVVEDDGGGLSLENIRQTAVRRGILTPEAAAALDESEAARLIFKPGFSTAAQVTTISGRGVGLDVVQQTAAELGGSIDISSTPGQGTRFTLDLPLTLAASMGLIVEAGRELVAIPSGYVERIVPFESADLGTVAGRTTLQLGSLQVPFVHLALAIGLTNFEPSFSERAKPALVLNAGGQRVAFAVEAVVAHDELVVQPLGRLVARAPHLAGAAVWEGGQAIAVLNPVELVRWSRSQFQRAAGGAERPRILVVDDSLTTRSAMRAILEIAGFDVIGTGDGEEALRLLKEQRFHLVVSDVQMPKMDGLALTQAIRADPGLKGLPVVLVTSLETSEDRAAGLKVGADGYLVKREVEHGKLLELVRQLLPRTT